LTIAADPNEPKVTSINRKMESTTDVIADMKSASTETLLNTARDIVAEKVGRSMVLDTAAEERVPKFGLSDVTVGRVLGRGGFCVVHEAKVNGLGGSLASKPKGLIRRVFGRGGEASSGRMSSTDSDWGELDSDAPGKFSVDLNGAVSTSQMGKRRKYVIKKISLESRSRVNFLKSTVDLAMETSFLASLEHPHIIRMYGVSSDGPFAEGYFIILEKVNETLTKRIKKWMDVDRQCKGITGVFTGVLTGSKKKLQKMQSERIAAALDIATGTAYMHDRSIMFRDLVSAEPSSRQGPFYLIRI
jgi:serine/threonine protein kinase